jgi:hypothetical protein
LRFLGSFCREKRVLGDRPRLSGSTAQITIIQMIATTEPMRTLLRELTSILRHFDRLFGAYGRLGALHYFKLGYRPDNVPFQFHHSRVILTEILGLFQSLQGVTQNIYYAARGSMLHLH